MCLRIVQRPGLEKEALETHLALSGKTRVKVMAVKSC